MDISHDQNHGRGGRKWAAAQKREAADGPGSQKGIPGGGGLCFSGRECRKVWCVGLDSRFVRVPREKKRQERKDRSSRLQRSPPLQKELGSHPGAFLAAASHAEIRCEMHCSLLAMILQVLIDFLCRVIFH